MAPAPKKHAPLHKTDPISPEARSFGKQFEDFFMTVVVPYRYHLLVTVLAALGLLIGIQAHAAHRRSVQAKAFLALSEAKDMDDLKGVAEDYAGLPAGFQAELKIARRLFDEGKYDLAATHFAKVADMAAAPAYLRASARLGEAYALEAQKKFPAAEKRFADLAESLDDNAEVVDAYLAAGRCAAAQKKFAEAEKWYKRAVASAKGDTTLERLAKDALEGVNTLRFATPPPKKAAEKKIAAAPKPAKAAKPVKAAPKAAPAAEKAPAKTAGTKAKK